MVFPAELFPDRDLPNNTILISDSPVGENIVYFQLASFLRQRHNDIFWSDTLPLKTYGTPLDWPLFLDLQLGTGGMHFFLSEVTIYTFI